MYLPTKTPLATADEVPQSLQLPPEVDQLAWRERQIAAMVYEQQLTTAKDVEARLSYSLTNATVRCFLNRLVRKGILLRQRRANGPAFVYAPALTDRSASEIALKRIADDFYDGSLSFLAEELSAFRARPSGLAELLETFDRAPPIELRALSPRMRQIATVVYRSGMATSRDIQSGISRPPTQACIRTLLSRMADRGLIRKHRSVRRGEIVYFPAIITRQTRGLVLKRFIHERFGDSTGAALQAALQLLALPNRAEPGCHLSEQTSAAPQGVPLPTP